MTTPHHLRCDWLEEARMRLLGHAIIFHDELFVKVITMNDVIGELKKERKGCYDANSTLQPKPVHCGHECVQACLAPSYNSCEYIGSTYNVVSKNDTRRQPSAEQRIEKATNPTLPRESPELVPILMYCRNVINTDKSGLAFGLARCKQIVEGYNWIPRGEWGDYDCTERTVKTLQKETGYLIEEIVSVCEQSLRESGERVNINIKEVETAIALLRGERR